MRSSEGVSFAYFAVMTAIAWLRPLPAARRLTITAVGVVTCTSIVGLARTAPLWLRDWSPALVILLGYYVSGRFFVKPSLAFEAWLMAWDRRLLGDPAARFARWPRPLLAYLDIVYMGTFIVVPLGFAVLAWAGRSAMADAYWRMVIAAEFGSFAPLSLVQTRPPWRVERKAAPSASAVHRLAWHVVQHLSHRANTFPSGHAAGSLAVALAVIGAAPAAGIVLLVIALSISAACIVGRYHYAVDVVAGVVLALLIWAVVT